MADSVSPLLSVHCVQVYDLPLWQNGECVASPLPEGVYHSWGRWWGTTCSVCSSRNKTTSQTQTSGYQSITQHRRSLRLCKFTQFWTDWRSRGRPVANFKAKPFLTCTLINVSIHTFLVFVDVMWCWIGFLLLVLALWKVKLDFRHLLNRSDRNVRALFGTLGPQSDTSHCVFTITAQYIYE